MEKLANKSEISIEVIDWKLTRNSGPEAEQLYQEDEWPESLSYIFNTCNDGAKELIGSS